jgi:hypothetical protein
MVTQTSERWDLVTSDVLFRMMRIALTDFNRANAARQEGKTQYMPASMALLSSQISPFHT